jgi:hypothetical protein
VQQSEQSDGKAENSGPPSKVWICSKLNDSKLNSLQTKSESIKIDSKN